jgi:tRNA-binding protein
MSTEQQGKPSKQIPFEEFEKVDLRVAQVLSAKMAVGTRSPCRILELELGPLGVRTSVGQYALIEEAELVGKKVIVCCNLGIRKIGRHESRVLVLGVPHPASPKDQAQALPLTVDSRATCGDKVF